MSFEESCKRAFKQHQYTSRLTAIYIECITESIVFIFKDRVFFRINDGIAKLFLKWILLLNSFNLKLEDDTVDSINRKVETNQLMMDTVRSRFSMCSTTSDRRHSIFKKYAQLTHCPKIVQVSFGCIKIRA